MECEQELRGVTVQRMCVSWIEKLNYPSTPIGESVTRAIAPTERVADEVLQQELRAIGEGSAADGQVIHPHLDITARQIRPSIGEDDDSLRERASSSFEAC